jgi:pimeloyl-ACP methyl ester carboxylesterase
MAHPRPAKMPADSTERNFNADGARLRYRDEGIGPAVLLVHGWALDLEMWDRLARALREEFRVVRLDRRGFGLSSGRAAVERDATDLDALCRHLALADVALLGMSQGARAVLRLAMCTERCISCLVLDGPPDLDRGAVFEEDATYGDVPLSRYRALLRMGGMDAVRREWAMHPLMRLRTVDPDARRLLDAILGRYPGNDLLEGAAGVGPTDERVRPEAIATPTLVITGEHDLPKRVQAADVLARRLPAAERAVISDAGHLPNLDNPVAYHNRVRAFLRRHLSAPL